MQDAHRRRMLQHLLAGSPQGQVTARLCDLCTDLAAVQGAGIMLMHGDIPTGSVRTSDDRSLLVEELQHALGEGPCIDAYRLDLPALEPDLAASGQQRWPAFTGPAVAAGVLAVFGFPMRVGAIRLGALNLYRDRPGPLTVEEHGNALMAADVAAEVVVMLQADADPGELAAELTAGADFHNVVHQATGMVAVQLGVDVHEALLRLRAFAFADGRTLKDVARAVVARQLRLDSSDG